MSRPVLEQGAKRWAQPQRRPVRPLPLPGREPGRRPRPGSLPPAPPASPARPTPWRPAPRLPRLPIPNPLRVFRPHVPLLPISPTEYFSPPNQQPDLIPNPSVWRESSRCEIEVGRATCGSWSDYGGGCISGQYIDCNRALGQPLPEDWYFGHWVVQPDPMFKRHAISWHRIAAYPEGEPVSVPDPAWKPKFYPVGDPFGNPATNPRFEPSIRPNPWANPQAYPEYVTNPFAAPFGRAGPVPREAPWRAWTVQGKNMTVGDPRTRQPPKPGEKERKTTAQRIGIALFRILNNASEAGDVIDAGYNALPKHIREDNPCNRAAFGIDKGGQYGIDNADCKAKTLYENYGAMDPDKFINGVIKNAVKDTVEGALHRLTPRNTGGALGPTEKDDPFLEIDKFLEDFVERTLAQAERRFGM